MTDDEPPLMRNSLSAREGPSLAGERINPLLFGQGDSGYTGLSLSSVHSLSKLSDAMQARLSEGVFVKR